MWSTSILKLCRSWLTAKDITRSSTTISRKGRTRMAIHHSFCSASGWLWKSGENRLTTSKIILCTSILNCEKFTTALHQKEVCLISRSLHTIPCNPSDLVRLTSINFRVELSLSATPELNIMPVSTNTLNGNGRKKGRETSGKGGEMIIWNTHKT